MMNERPDGLNVDNWDHRELIMMVDDFTSHHVPKANANDDLIYDDPQPAVNDAAQEYNDDPGTPQTYDYNPGTQNYDAYEEDKTPSYSNNNDYYYNQQQRQDTYADPEYGVSEYDNNDQFDDDEDISNTESSQISPAIITRMNTNPKEDKIFEDFVRNSEKRVDLMNRYEAEREAIRVKEREEELKALKEQKKEEREKRKVKKDEKKKLKEKRKAEREEQEALNKARLEEELEKALANENLGKKFSDMVPKNMQEYRAYKATIPGIKTGESELNASEDVKIKIRDPALKDDGFFSGKYLCFIVETSPLGWSVERRDKDFNDLRDYLVKLYPHVLVPACPEFTHIKTLDKSFLRKRESLLTRFMNKLMMQKELKA